MHIKVIKGRKYYYKSKRMGSKVISIYVGPVKEEEQINQVQQQAEQQEIKQAEQQPLDASSEPAAAESGEPAEQVQEQEGPGNEVPGDEISEEAGAEQGDDYIG